MADEKKRVLVVDDSVFARKIVTDLLDSSPHLVVVGTAIDGIDALAKVESLKPDVITLDVEMPKFNGIETLRRLMATRPTPVVMVSSLTQTGAKESIEALKLGAIDIVAKPHGTHSIGLAAQQSELIEKVVAAAGANLKCLNPVTVKPAAAVPETSAVTPAHEGFAVVIIASSTGGPRALRSLIPALSPASGAAFVVVQHLPPGFSKTMADDLDKIASLTVVEASSEQNALRPGVVLFAKSGYHLVVNRNGSASLSLSPPLWGVRPSADVTMVSAAPVFGSRVVGVVLTGMGSDGAAGLRSIKEHGGTTIAEHESTCVVYGMPRVAIESGVVDIIAPVDRMAEAINGAVARAHLQEKRPLRRSA